MNAYNLIDVTKTRERFVLSIDQCCLDAGEVYAVVGANGCGKSTFLDLLGFMEPSWTGTVEYRGRRVDSGRTDVLLTHRRKVGYLMQNPYLFNASVFENIRYGLKIRGASRADAGERVTRIMADLGLSHLARRNAHALSGGEAQRVALARTLVLDVDVFLLDEPTANVDRQNVDVVETLIRRLNRERQATIILTTHSERQATRMSQRVISITDGRIDAQV